MNKTKVLVVGATGETGGDIVNGLLEDGTFDISLLIRSSSVNKPAVQAFKANGTEIVIGDTNCSVETLTPLLSGFDTVISAIGADLQLDQLSLVDAAAKAGVKRFVPCGFITVAPPGGVMLLRDEKEVVYTRIFVQHLPYTIIDVGYWHQISIPSLPSGKFDYALMRPRNTIFGDGKAPNLLTDKRDIGRFVARIIKDERTLNKKVFTYSDVLSQNQITEIVEEASGEKIKLQHKSAEDLARNVQEARLALKRNEKDRMKRVAVYSLEYDYSKYVRRDNTPEFAAYLGYIDGKKLYPDFKPIAFKGYVKELLEGKGQRPYTGRF